jgi:hypothetical protein
MPALHSSRFSLRFPQRVSFRSGLNSRTRVAVERYQHADARQPGPTAASLGRPDQVLDCDLPYLEILLCLLQFGDGVAASRSVTSFRPSAETIAA